MFGGTKFNVIPSSATCMFSCDLDEEELNNIISDFLNKEKEIYPSLNIILEKVENEVDFLKNTDSFAFLNSIIDFPHGVMNKNSRGEPTTSANLGAVNLRDMMFKIGIRSSRKDEGQNILNFFKDYAIKNNYVFEVIGSQPGFLTSDNDSLLQELIVTHNFLFKDRNLDIKSLHITVEAGFFQDKINDLQIAIISPKILGAHSPNECVEIKSILECDMWLEKYLESKGF